MSVPGICTSIMQRIMCATDMASEAITIMNLSSLKRFRPEEHA